MDNVTTETPSADRGVSYRDAVPGPVPTSNGSLSLLRRLRQMRQTYPIEVFENLISEQKIGRFRYIILNDPDAIRHVLVENAKSYGKSPFLRRLLEPALGQGLLTSDGETWQRHRRLMAPVFAHRNLNRFAPAIATATSHMLERWDRSSDGSPIDLADEMSMLTLSSIARTMFGAEDDRILEGIVQIVARYQDAVGIGLADLLGLPNWVPRLSTIRGRYIVRHLNQVVDQLIERDRRPGHLLIDILTDDGGGSGQKLSRQEVRDQIVTILTAGHETTAQTMNWTWYLLSKHPDVEVKLIEELDEVLGGRTPAYEDLSRLVYAKAVVQESMRLFPPVPTFSRLCLADDAILGRRVAKGSIVMIAPWILHRHRSFWSDPDIFEPERFLETGERPRAYIPFGAGPRICIGASFAMMEAVLILAQVAQRYRLRLMPGHRIEPVVRIALRSRYGMKMIATRRSAAGLAKLAL
ncbi:cytochrome P450 [Rhizobium leguminosarum]|uniref:cytochrome P450 n=1 Tax=Rhizobium leguminosarum TaxID=384 RepID=UPI001C94506F|nr:cytochrome P450 [Rhizobium leguminosarum]MBY5775352.1 cytochrome P450 [Rhizobium leguminosarum]